MNKIVRLLVLDMRKWMAAAFFVMALLLVASNQLLVRQIQDAKKEVVAVRRLYNEPPSGVELQPITGLNLQGDRVSIRYGEGEVGTVLLVGAAECFYTDANWKFWENLRAFDWFRRQTVVFVDLSKVLSPGFFTSKGVSLSDVMRVDAEVKLAYNLRLTPQTIIVGPDGRLKGAWSGMLTRDNLRDIVRFASAGYGDGPAQVKRD